MEGTMTRYIMMVLTNPVAGQEDAYNSWYNQEHVPDVVRVNGFCSGQRFRLAGTGLGNVHPPSHHYRALYEVEADSAEAANAELIEAARGGAISGHDSLDLSSVATLFFEPIAERHVG
jgi:hypothetical protein